MINSYSEYLKQLKEKIRKNNYQMLLDSDIILFITTNMLDANYDITVSDVKTDIKAIILKHNQQIHIQQKKNRNSNKKMVTNKMVKTYQQYEKLLKEAIIKNNSVSLNNAQVNDFIRKNNLDCDWGITNSDVYKDMKDILSRMNKMTSKSIESVKKKNEIKQDDNSSFGNDGLYNEFKLSDDDLEIVNLIKKYMIECPSVFKETKRIRALLNDLIPEKRIEVNLLSFLAESGILSENDISESNRLICNQYISIIKSNFGTNGLIAERMVRIWVACLEQV